MSSLVRERTLLQLQQRRADVLAALGLRERRPRWALMLPLAGIVGAGALLGAAGLLLFAPSMLMRRRAAPT